MFLGSVEPVVIISPIYYQTLYHPPTLDFYGSVVSNKAVRNFKKQPGSATKNILIAQFMVA